LKKTINNEPENLILSDDEGNAPKPEKAEENEDLI